MQKGHPVRHYLAEKPPREGVCRSRSQACDVAGCFSATREGKPYCPEHVEEADYVKAIVERLKAQEREIKKVFKRGHRAVDINGPIVPEIIGYLRANGSKTRQRMERECLAGQLAGIGCEYIRAMRRAKLITTAISRRGLTVVTLR